MERYIQARDFCRVITDSIEELPKGTVVYVAGTQALPIYKGYGENYEAFKERYMEMGLDESESSHFAKLMNSYTQRIYAYIHSTDEGGHVNSEKIFVVDPLSLEFVSDGDAEKLNKILFQDFGPGEEDLDTPN